MRIPKFEYFHHHRLRRVVPSFTKTGRGKDLSWRNRSLRQNEEKTDSSKVVISLNGIQKLNRIEWNDKEGLKIGPLVTHEALVNHPIVKEKFDFLSEACFKIGTRQVRNMGTLVGNLCNASPSSDASAPLLVLEQR